MSSKSDSVSGISEHEFKDAHDFPNHLNIVESEKDDSDTDSEASFAAQLPSVHQTPHIGKDTPWTKVSTATANASDASIPNVSSSIARMREYVASDSDASSPSKMNTNEPRSLDVYRTAPIFTSEVSNFLETKTFHKEFSATSFSQFGLIGLRDSMSENDDENTSANNARKSLDDNLVIGNMDMPWSAFICGSQGAGKSHTLSCLLENALLEETEVGRLPNPLAAMVFHYDSYSSAACTQVCEAAYLCSSGIPVTILVCPSNVWAMTDLYANLPGLSPSAHRPKILPLYLAENLLNITTMQTLMAIDPTSGNTPLYMETVTSILRAMAMEGKGTGAFSYAEFRSRLDEVQWAPGQQVPLNLRLQLLDSFLEPSQFTQTTRPAPATEDIWAFKPGTLTIVDLSDPFVSSSDACSLFSICLSLFMAKGSKRGKMIALDEAHKFLTQTGTARALTSSLTSVIRQQRHTGTRVVIATQEPTLSPELIDLANATFVHRFMSPAWYEVLKHHLAGAKKHDSTSHKTSLFETIVALETGEALLFCPTALVNIDYPTPEMSVVEKLSNSYMKVKIRKRVTVDGGKSILASDAAAPVSSTMSNQIRMHVVARVEVSKSSNTGRSQAPTTTNSKSNTGSSLATPKISLPPPKPHASVTRTVTQSQTVKKTGPLQLNDPLMNEIRALTRSIMRKNVSDLGWGKLKEHRVKTIISEIETKLKQQPGSLVKNSLVFQSIKWVAQDELTECLSKQNGTK